MQIQKEEFFVRSSIAGCDIHVIRKHCGGGFPLLMLHGLSLPPQFNYDMPFDGVSMADLLAAKGIDCYMMSALGYGNSSKPNDQFNRFNDWYRDIIDVMDRVDIKGVMGWSGSAIPAMMVAERHAISKLIVYGIPRFRFGRMMSDPRPDLYKQFTLDDIRSRRYKDIPVDLQEEILPARWFDEWCESLKSAMPINMPLGTEWDRAMIRRGELSMTDFVDLKNIQCDCLFTSGAWDTDIDQEEFRDTLAEIGSKNKQLSLVEGGTHWMPMETGRDKIARLIADFLRS